MACGWMYAGIHRCVIIGRAPYARNNAVGESSPRRRLMVGGGGWQFGYQSWARENEGNEGSIQMPHDDLTSCGKMPAMPSCVGRSCSGRVIACAACQFTYIVLAFLGSWKLQEPRDAVFGCNGHAVIVLVCRHLIRDTHVCVVANTKGWLCSKKPVYCRLRRVRLHISTPQEEHSMKSLENNAKISIPTKTPKLLSVAYRIEP